MVAFRTTPQSPLVVSVAKMLLVFQNVTVVSDSVLTALTYEL